MKVLMYGWEFPPYNSGGLGTACYGLTKSLAKLNTDITFVLPFSHDSSPDFLNLTSAHLTFKQIDSPLKPYLTSTQYRFLKGTSSRSALYGESLFEEVERLRAKAQEVVAQTDFHIIHCHDWMTFPVGIESKKISGKPLIVHVHSTEFDRGGGTALNSHVYKIEKQGMEQADQVIAVSNYTKNMIIEHYGISEEKISVVHNAVEEPPEQTFDIKKRDKIVLFLGRLTLQKGPDYFLKAANEVLKYQDNVKFIIAGTGDMEHYLMEETARLGISKHVLFSGFLNQELVNKMYAMADLYVMPSVSEPFGITALEAIQNGTPVILSNQSGVSEVITHCLKVDFWDTQDMANKILSVLRSPALYHSLSSRAQIEVKKYRWDTPAKQCKDIYRRFINE